MLKHMQEVRRAFSRELISSDVGVEYSIERKYGIKVTSRLNLHFSPADLLIIYVLHLRHDSVGISRRPIEWRRSGSCLGSAKHKLKRRTLGHVIYTCAPA